MKEVLLSISINIRAYDVCTHVYVIHSNKNKINYVCYQNIRSLSIIYACVTLKCVSLDIYIIFIKNLDRESRRREGRESVMLNSY